MDWKSMQLPISVLNGISCIAIYLFFDVFKKFQFFYLFSCIFSFNASSLQLSHGKSSEHTLLHFSTLLCMSTKLCNRKVQELFHLVHTFPTYDFPVCLCSAIHCSISAYFLLRFTALFVSTSVWFFLVFLFLFVASLLFAHVVIFHKCYYLFMLKYCLTVAFSRNLCRELATCCMISEHRFVKMKLWSIFLGLPLPKNRSKLSKKGKEMCCDFHKFTVLIFPSRNHV